MLEFRITGQHVLPHPLEMQAIDRRRLVNAIASLAGANDSARIIAAIGLAMTRAYR